MFELRKLESVNITTKPRSYVEDQIRTSLSAIAKLVAFRKMVINESGKRVNDDE